MADISKVNLPSDPNNPYNIKDAYARDQLTTLGGGENLTDISPYNFRVSGGSLNTSSVDIGNREEDKLIGGTVAWNQLYNYTAARSESKGVGRTINNGLITFDGESTDIGSSVLFAWTDFTIPVGHKIVVLKDFNLPSGDYLFDQYNTTTGKDICNTVLNITAGFCIPQLRISAIGQSYTGISGHLSVIDLTQLFGSTIADYIYSLEQATAGAGVSWFRNLFPNSYYAYNAGELMSVKTSAHNMVGFNQWDEDWEQGSINDSTGEPSTSNAYSRSKNFIKVIPDTDYYFYSKTSVQVVVYEYDYNQNYIGLTVVTNLRRHITAKTQYIKIRILGGSYTLGNVCVNFYNTALNGTYEPYSKNEYPLDTDLELRGIPKLDSSNNLYYDGDEYESNGNVKRKYHVYTFTGQESVVGGESMGTYYRWRLTVSGFGNKQTHTSLWSNGAQPLYNYTSDTSHYYLQNGVVWYFTKASTSAAVLAEVQGTSLVADVATPTTETAQPYQNPQIVNDFGTEEYVDTRDVAIPVGHETTYLRNLKEKLEDAPAIPTDNGNYILSKTNGGAEYVSFADSNNAVTQTATTTNANYEVLFSESADNTTKTEGARKTDKLTFNPSTDTLTTRGFTSKASDGTERVQVFSHRATKEGMITLIDSSDSVSVNIKANTGDVVCRKINGKDASGYLSDTTITTPSNADLLAYDSSTSKWVNTDLKGTASGSIATFSNGGNDIPVSEFECEIVAQQASGTPSPLTPLPITGFSQADITVTDNDQISNLYTVAFGQTIYGGRLIYANGEWAIEATHGIATLNSADRQGGMGNAYYAYDSVNGKPADMTQSNYATAICDKYKCATSSAERNNGYFYLLGGLIVFVDSRFTDVATANSILQSETPTVVYPLETPVIIPITSSTRVKTISGDNNIYSNTGDCEVKYFTDKADNIADLIKAFL